MRLYRLTPTKFAADMTGEGARLYGGRWTPPGIPVIHTAQTVALATLEFLVHQKSLPRGNKNVSLVIYDLPEEAPFEKVEIDGLPEGWDHYPPSTGLWKIGQEWVERNRAVALLVPSAVLSVSTEQNVLINPAHPAFSQFRLLDIKPFRFDERLQGNG